MFKELSSRGEFSIGITDSGVRVLHAHGTRNYPNVGTFLLNYVPEMFDQQTPVKLTCTACGGWEPTTVSTCRKADNRMRRHFPADGKQVQEVIREEQGKLCNGSMRPGVLHHD